MLMKDGEIQLAWPPILVRPRPAGLRSGRWNRRTLAFAGACASLFVVRPTVPLSHVAPPSGQFISIGIINNGVSISSGFPAAPASVYAVVRVDVSGSKPVRGFATDVRRTRASPHASAGRTPSRAGEDDGSSHGRRAGPKGPKDLTDRLARDGVSERAATCARRFDRYAGAKRRGRPVRG